MRNCALAFIVLATAGLTFFGVDRLVHAGDGAQTIEPTQTTEASATDPPCILPTESFNGKTIAQWRAQGPEGLAELIEQMRPSIKTYIKSKTQPKANPTPQQAAELAEAHANVLMIDAVAKQRDGYVSQLYWYTDLDEAKAQAQRTGRPILSLRMLGNLDEEYSCANSRFFRTVLYADRSVGEMLREKVVLHWQSVRPVPVITINMGDGRTIKRTLTGNSAHYLLDSNGRVVDCLPGLYGAGTFKRILNGSMAVASEAAEMDDSAFTEKIQQLHMGQGFVLNMRWSRIASAAVRKVDDPNVEIPDARAAGRFAAGKSIVEAPLVDAVLPNLPTPEKADADRELWDNVALAYAEEAKLDPLSKAVMRRKTITAEQAGAISRSKRLVEDPLLAMVRNFENAIALDTARNEHLLHRELHNWFIEAHKPMDLDKLNSRVYAELFLTPDSDPWLGLVPADTYSALDEGGLIQ